MFVMVLVSMAIVVGFFVFMRVPVSVLFLVSVPVFMRMIFLVRMIFLMRVIFLMSVLVLMGMLFSMRMFVMMVVMISVIVAFIMQHPDTFQRGHNQPIQNRAGRTEHANHSIRLRIVRVAAVHQTMSASKR